MAQIFLGNDPKSMAVELIAKYTRAVDSDLVKLNEVTPEHQKELAIPSLPCMLVTEDGKTFKCTSPYAIFRHIAEVTRFEKIFLGRNELDNNQILSYFELMGGMQPEELAEMLNNDLKLKMFLVSFNITAADIFAYTHVVSYVQTLQDYQKLAQNNLFRWVDHIQHLPNISKFVESKSLFVPFPNEDAKQPSKSQMKKMAKKQYLEQNKANKQNKENKDKEETKGGKAQPESKDNEENKDALESTTTTEKSNKNEGGKKGKKQQNQPKKGPPVDDSENIEKLDIRVGQIVDVWKHPDSVKLYCEKIDLGESEPRQIASGLQEFVPLEKMQNAMVVVLANLKAKKLAGFPSHGMVLCAETQDKSSVELLVPPEGSKVGDQVSIKGYNMKPLDVLNPKKKIFESVVEDLNVDENGVAKYKNAEFVTEKGLVISEGIKNGIIR